MKFWWPYATLVCLCVLGPADADARGRRKPPKPATKSVVPTGDVSPPVIIHTPVTQGAVGRAIEVVAKFQDASPPVFAAKLYFRRVGDLEYVAMDFVEVSPERWVAQVPDVFVTRDVQYFVAVYDRLGNGPAEHGTANLPHLVKVASYMGGLSELTKSNGSSTQPFIATSNSQLPLIQRPWFLGLVIGGAAAVVVGVTLGVLCATQVGICQGSYDTVGLRIDAPDVRRGL